MKKNYKSMILFLVVIFLFSLQVFAYSNKVILGGESVGIHIETTGVMVIGFYPVNGEYVKGTPEIQIGDLIIKVNQTQVSSISCLLYTSRCV